ncbi:hypothetical protein FRC03_007408 [Tulasnella sp. 419]|nr:hypothetical protein FRC03_007408 [Tulasnella sp. 419]
MINHCFQIYCALEDAVDGELGKSKNFSTKEYAPIYENQVQTLQGMKKNASLSYSLLIKELGEAVMKHTKKTLGQVLDEPMDASDFAAEEEYARRLRMYNHFGLMGIIVN